MTLRISTVNKQVSITQIIDSPTTMVASAIIAAMVADPSLLWPPPLIREASSVAGRPEEAATWVSPCNEQVLGILSSERSSLLVQSLPQLSEDEEVKPFLHLSYVVITFVWY